MRTAITVLAAALLVAGCSGLEDPSQRTTDSLTGTITPLAIDSTKGIDIKTVTVSQRGEVDIKLVSVVPTYANPLYLYFTLQVSGNCPLTVPLTQVLVGNVVPLGLVDAGTYCIGLADNGSMQVPEIYTIQVTHP